MAKERMPRRDAEPEPVSVADLLAKFQGEDESTLPSRPTRMYQTIAVLAGFALLSAAGIASTAALSGPRAERAVPSATSNAIAAISGADALHPDLINTSVALPPLNAAPPPADDGGPARNDGNPNLPDDAPQSQPQQDSAPPDDSPPAEAAPGTPDPPDQQPDPPEPPGSSDGNSDSGASNSALGPIMETVRIFYETAPIAPRKAFDLLDPSMRGTGYDDFQQAWAGVRRAKVEDIRQDGPNTVLVIVRLERDDGTMLRTLQHVQVTPGTQPLIAGAELLSASRS